MFHKFYLVVLMFLTIHLSAQDIESVTKNKKDILKINGSVSLGSWFYNATGIEQRRTPFSWYLSGAPTITLAGFAMPFSATISEQERSFQQPFNQIGVSPYYKWIKLHLGYRNLIFSDFTLGGATFLGAGIELSPKKFKLAAFYGRLRRGIDEDTNLQFTVLPSFKRMAKGVKIGFGSAVNFLEISVLNSRDELGSANISSNSFIKPEDNLVFGIKQQWQVFKKVSFGADAAISAITYNKLLGTENLDSLGADAAKFSFINNYLYINASSMAKLAGQFFANYQSKNWSVKWMSKMVEPDYISHGANFIQDDLLQHTISPSFSLFKQRVNLGLSGGVQTDNLDNKKRATTERIIGSVNVNFRPLKRMIAMLSYSNYGTNQSSGAIQLNDSIRMSLVNASYNASIAYQFPSKKTSSQLSFNFQKSDVLDRNELTRKFSQSNIHFYNLNYSLGINKIKTNVTVGANWSDVNAYQNNVQAIGTVLSMNKAFFKNKLRFSTSFNFQNRYVNSVGNGYILSNNTDVNIQIKNKHQIGFGMGFMKNTSSVNSFRVFNEQRARLNYGFNF